ncbi:MAG: DUF58 domain-containing protein [Clostridia bacterium]|nr:DUF58 domain-containing protein [Clostridia bacterium]
MGSRRLVYVTALLFGLVFHTLYGQYLSYIVLLFLLLLPVFSLLISLPVMLRVRIRLFASGTCQRGEKAAARLLVNSRSPLPVGCLSFTFSGENRFTGEKLPRQKQVYWGVRQEEQTLPLPSHRCGVITCRIERAWVWDYLGILAFPIQKTDPATYTILPQKQEPRPAPELSQDSALQLRPKPGGGYSEEHELRPYRQGDPLNAIHWKLTSKLDEPIVREPQLMKRKQVTLSITPAKGQAALESQLDQLNFLSLDLIQKGIPHRVCFGAHRESFVRDKNSLDECLLKILCTPPDGTHGPVDRNKPNELVYAIRPKRKEATA